MVIRLSDSTELDIQLELKERLAYNNILTASLLNLKRAIGQPEMNLNQIQALILDFFTDIPRTWHDQQFKKDVKLCATSHTVTVYPYFAGVPLEPEVCKELDIETQKTITEVDFFALKNAIVNLLDRLNLLIRKEKIEYSTGVNLEDTLEELGELYDVEQEDFDEDSE